MQPQDEPAPRRLVSVPSLIGWLSVCILAAAWGKSLDERWQSLWAYTGAYGLAAALGLSLVERTRIAHQRWLQNRALQARIESGLESLSEQGATQSSIQAAMRRLTEFAARRMTADGSRGKGTPQGSRGLELVPMEVTPIIDPDAENCELGEGIPGTLRDVSARGTTFSHQIPFVAPVALLTFHLDQTQLSFVVDMRWSKVVGDSFLSGGTVLAVGVPADNGSARPTSEPRETCPV